MVIQNRQQSCAMFPSLGMFKSYTIVRMGKKQHLKYGNCVKIGQLLVNLAYLVSLQPLSKPDLDLMGYQPNY